MNVSKKCPRGDRGVIGGDFNGHVSEGDRRKNVTSQHQMVFCSITLKIKTRKQLKARIECLKLKKEEGCTEFRFCVVGNRYQVAGEYSCTAEGNCQEGVW